MLARVLAMVFLKLAHRKCMIKTNMITLKICCSNFNPVIHNVIFDAPIFARFEARCLKEVVNLVSNRITNSFTIFHIS